MVKVFAAEPGIASCCLDLEDAIFETEKRDVKGSAAEVIDQDLAFFSFLLIPGQELAKVTY